MPGNEVYLTYKGATRTITEWAQRLRLSMRTVHHRFHGGLPVERVLDQTSGHVRRRQARDEAWAHPACAFCGEPNPPRNVKGEPRHSAFCSSACGSHAKAYERRMTLPQKRCEQCSQFLVLRHRETDRQWAVRRFCSGKCRALKLGNNHAGRVKPSPWNPKAQKKCRACHCAFTWQKRRTPVQWKAQRFCSMRCWNEWRLRKFKEA
jgi:hypothetical protein